WYSHRSNTHQSLCMNHQQRILTAAQATCIDPHSSKRSQVCSSQSQKLALDTVPIHLYLLTKCRRTLQVE
ncbi:MAG TPA: hypothetical protein VHA52_02795, partial [Candidatus Babeliaceae bacterium]|nr:hypothetical protein [Candidatus Babeliaceae bacterium]